MWLHPGCYKKATPASTSERTEQCRHWVVLHLVSLSVCVFTSSWGGLLLRCANQELRMCSIPKSLHLLCVLVRCNGVRKLGLGHQRKVGKLRQQSYTCNAYEGDRMLGDTWVRETKPPAGRRTSSIPQVHAQSLQSSWALDVTNTQRKVRIILHCGDDDEIMHTTRQTSCHPCYLKALARWLGDPAEGEKAGRKRKAI